MPPVAETIRISWELEIADKICNFCDSPLRFAHSTSGKIVHCLDGDYNQIVNLYHCPDDNCEGAKRYVNPSPKLDYSGRYYGRDVFRTVADFVLRVKLKAEQIQLMLEGMGIEISLSTVKSMIKDVILLKSDAIDRRTAQIINQQESIILCLDGQEPDNGTRSLWLFTDLISGRVLYTRLLDQADHKTIHQLIELVLDKYHTKLKGIISDKQNNLVKCMQTYYADIPHQYCTFHFTSNIWRHLEMFDNRTHMALRKVIKKSILYKAPKDRDITVNPDGTKENASVVFAETRKDMMKLLKERSIKFEFLHGIDLFQKFSKFCDDMQDLLAHLPENIQLSNIISRELEKFRAALTKVKQRSKEAEIAFTRFELMYSTLYNKELTAMVREQNLEEQFNGWWQLALQYGCNTKREELKSILPKASTTIDQYFAEAVRLWDRYRSGLFQYQHFDELFQTNVDIERMFSKEVTYILGQSSKRRIGFVIETKGEYYLRLLHATKGELEEDILNEFSQQRLDQLREELQQKITYKTSEWIRTADIGNSIEYLKRKYGMHQLYHPMAIKNAS